MKYIPSPVPQDPKQLSSYFNLELQRIADSQNQPFNLTKMYVAPVKPFDGQIVYADGTHWAPDGSGPGIFAYIGTGWVRL